MRAIVFKTFGGPDVLEMVELDGPACAPDQVLVRVKATSVNPVDIQTRRGDYAEMIPLPGRLGVDVAGIIERVGGAVRDLRPGDEVYYAPRLLKNEGGYATHHVEDAAIVALKPANLSFEEAAAMPLAAGTAWECLIERGQLEPGESVLVHAGTGGVGSYAIQIARAAGAYVVTTCRGDQAGFATELGADAVVDYRATDLDAQLAAAAGGHGFDLVLDTLGGHTIERSLGHLAHSGRLVTVVDHSTPQNLIHGWARNISLLFVLTTQRRERLQRIGSLVERGLLRPVVERIMPLRAAAQAHRLMESGNRRGKIVLSVDA